MTRLGEGCLRAGFWWAAAALRARLVWIRDRWQAYERSEARGLALLSAWLSPEQRSQFEKHKRFDVIGSASGKR